MAKTLLENYTFDASEKKIIVRGNYNVKEWLLITNTTDNLIIYNFAQQGRGGSATYDKDTNLTTLTLEYDTTTMSDTDYLQIYADKGGQKIVPDGPYSDPVDKMRVSNPQSLIDTDFEYSLQPTKWETVQLQANIPGIYQKANEPAFTAEQITSISASTLVTPANTTSITYDTSLESASFTTIEDFSNPDNNDTSASRDGSIGFNVTVNGFTFNTVRGNNNGVLFFGTRATGNGDISNIGQSSYPGSTAYGPILKMFGTDMEVAKYSKRSTGTSPNRVFIWKAEYAPNGSSTQSQVDKIVYVKFFEGQNKIECHYEKFGSAATIVALDDPRTSERILSWSPTVNTTSPYFTRQAFSLNLDTISRDGLQVTVTVAPTIPFYVGQPIIFKETKDPTYLDTSFLIVSTSGSTSFGIIPNSPTTYVGNQKTDYTVIYTGGFYFSSELPLTSVSRVSGGRNLKVTFSTNHSLFIGSTIYVVDSASSDTDWIGSFEITKVLSNTEVEFLGASDSDYTDSNTVSDSTTKVYVRNNGSAIHRYFDGGVQISPEGYSPNCQIVRQTRGYFRYQSGKGIQFSTGILFKPTYDVFQYSVDTSNYDATTYPYYDMFIETDQVHGFKLPGDYLESINITLEGFTVSGGSNPYNVSGTSINGVSSPKDFSLQIPIDSGSVPTDTNPGGLIRIIVNEWNDAVVRSGLFDQQNGLFFEHDGDDLYCVKRNSTTQISGFITATTDSSIVTGDGTKFTTQLYEGDFVVIKGQAYYITSIDSDTQITVAPDYKGLTVERIKLVKTVEQRVKRSDFNLDVLDGNGPSGYVFDASKMQMVFLDYSWYGAGKIRYGMRGTQGEVFYFHEFVNNNLNTEAYMRTGNLPARFEINTVSKSGYLKSSMTTSSTTLDILTEDAYYLPSAGTININNEYIEYTKGSESGDNTTLNLVNRNVGFLSAGNTTGSVNDTWLSVNQNFSPTLSHWGVSVIMDGKFDVDKSYLFTASNAGNKTITAGNEEALLTIRLAPSVDYGIPGFYGVRNLINRSLVTLKTIGVVATGQFTITVKINGESTLFETESNWDAAGNGSISQYVDHTDNTEVIGGDVIGLFLTDEGGTRATSSTLDISDVRDLSNSVLGGPNSFPDGPDTLTIFAKNNGAQAGNVKCRISWTEAQG